MVNMNVNKQIKLKKNQKKKLEENGLNKAILHVSQLHC